jgi:restriction system protein
MARKKSITIKDLKSLKNLFWPVIVLIILPFVEDHVFAVVTFLVVFLIIFVGYAWRKSWKRQQQFLSLKLADVDNMDGLAFEHYVGKLLESRGYRAKVTRASCDNGVDIIAERNGSKWAIQCKRYAQSVSRTAVSDAVAATSSTIFNCSRAMVVTNSYFTKGAVSYAKSTDCVLVDRDVLAAWIYDLKNLTSNA